LRRFAHEARLSAYVRHTNVVPVEHFGHDTTGPYLVLEYIESMSLDTLVELSIARGMPPPRSIVLRIVCDALAGLHAVHEATDSLGQPLDIIHRDVSMQNILVGRDGVARLTDLGIAKSTLAPQRTARHRLMGRVIYMSPEYVRLDPLDRRHDVYAMGMALWVALSGSEPWAELMDTDILHEIEKGRVPPMSARRHEIPPEIEALVRRACAPNRDDRFESAAAMRQAIEELSRRAGWMADEVDVAAWVEQLAGRRLDATRRRIAECASSPSRITPARIHRFDGRPDAAHHESGHQVVNRERTRSGTRRGAGPSPQERAPTTSQRDPRQASSRPPPGVPYVSRRWLDSIGTRGLPRRRSTWLTLLVLGALSGMLLAAGSDWIGDSAVPAAGNGISAR
jgi:serine/threonine-protein kinase